MTQLTGTWLLVRFTLRRDRIRILIWVVSVTAFMIATAASIKELFPTQADLDLAAVASANNAAAIAFNGPVQGLNTVGGEVAFQSGTFGLVLVALMSLLMIARYTRVEEESGRTELLRATVLGRDAQTATAILVVTGMNVVIGVAVTTSLILEHLPAVGSVSFGASLLAIGLVFSAVALVTTQISENSRVGSALAGAILGYSFAIRAVGDIGDGRLSWLSPIGWSQKPRPYAGERWWPFMIPVAVTIILLMVARVLTARRDWGAGLIQARPGPFRAAPSLSRPLGLAARLQRATLFAWTFALLLLGFVYGAIANDIGNFVGDNETLKQLMAAAGGTSLTDAYFGTAMLVMALTGAGYALQSVQRLRTEETALHTEVVLATPTSRLRWMAGNLTLTLGGSAVVMTAAGLGAGVPYAVEIGDTAQIPSLVGAAVVYLPAIWLLAGIAAVLYGLAPRILSAAWAILAICFVIGFLGEVLKLPRWIIELSPFQHTPQLPAASLTLAPLTILAIAAALNATGIAAFRRRDLG
jgi:polyether ionophore transport system permease protein